MSKNDGYLDSHDLDGSVLSNSVVKENENQNVDLLEDFDSYLDDINNRLTVSKLVSDSVTIGMLNAVESEAAEKIAEKENEISRWKEVLLLSPVGSEESGTSGSRLILEQIVESCGVESSVLEKTKEIAGLRRELESISKLLTGYENGGSEVLDSKISKSLGSACSVWDRNGKHIGSLALTPSKLEELKQLSCEQLINHFKNEMNEMKREHDYTIQEMTEEYFSVNRRYLKLKANGMFSCLKKDKELDVLRKKIPDIILKLDKILLEDDESVFEGKNDAYFKSRCDSLLEENRKLRESLKEAEREIDLGDSCVESFMAEECCTIIYKEALKDADKKLGELNINVSEREQALRLEIVESERLKEKILLLECLVKEKGNLVQIAENDLATEKEKLEIVFQQNDTLQYQIDQQAMVIQDKNEELGVTSGRALEETERCEMEISELRQKLELARKNMKIIENEKVKSDLKLSSSEAEQKRLKNQFVLIVLSLAEWSQCFDNIECSVAEKLMKTNSRLESMQSQLSDLLDEVDELKARESIYKQLMEKKTCDLQKAETEVDLLGDQIESFLDLLKKIYIALDHYSPILKHYPGVIEILKLVRRELRGESKRLSVVRTSLT